VTISLTAIIPTTNHCNSVQQEFVIIANKNIQNKKNLDNETCDACQQNS
jgi:hypothetical protein